MPSRRKFQPEPVGVDDIDRRRRMRSLAIASYRTDLSPATLRWRYGHLIVQISEHREAISEENIEAIANGTAR